eukprot:6061242-Pleurochrysis_carterae.AAC.1
MKFAPWEAIPVAEFHKNAKSIAEADVLSKAMSSKWDEVGGVVMQRLGPPGARCPAATLRVAVPLTGETAGKWEAYLRYTPGPTNSNFASPDSLRVKFALDAGMELFCSPPF